jgi:hypothetical protein
MMMTMIELLAIEMVEDSKVGQKTGSLIFLANSSSLCSLVVL